MDLGRKKPEVIGHLAVRLAFAVLTATMTYPLVLRVSRSGPGWPGDNLHYVRLLWWFKNALIDQGMSLDFNPNVYVPEGLAMARGEMTPANTLLALPLTALGGPVIAYNVIRLVSFVLTGFATYLWVWRLTEHRLAGFVAGFILAFCPYRMAHLPGHLPLMQTQWFPFLLYSFEEVQRTRMASPENSPAHGQPTLFESKDLSFILHPLRERLRGPLSLCTLGASVP